MMSDKSLDEETEHRKFNEFIDGLRSYIKHESHGQFRGKLLAENWDELSEEEQDKLISEAFVINALFLTTIAHEAIHGKVKD